MTNCVVYDVINIYYVLVPLHTICKRSQKTPLGRNRYVMYVCADPGWAGGKW